MSSSNPHSIYIEVDVDSISIHEEFGDFVQSQAFYGESRNKQLSEYLETVGHNGLEVAWSFDAIPAGPQRQLQNIKLCALMRLAPFEWIERDRRGASDSEIDGGTE